MKTNSVFNDFLNSSLKSSCERERNEVKKINQITIRCIKKSFGRKYAKQATETSDGVYIGPYKFIGEKKESLYVGIFGVNWEYYLFYINENGKKIAVNSMADFGDYIKREREYDSVIKNTFGENK